MKTSNKFTLARVCLAPLFFILYFIPLWTGRWSSFSVFILIPLLAFMEFTDFLDGHFARKHHEVSDLGKLFDPFADVTVHLTTFCCFMLTGQYEGHPGGYLPPLIFILILYREFSMTFIRMVATKKGVAIAARKGGKLKTVLYVASGFFCLAVESSVRLGLPVGDFLPLFHKIAFGLFCACAAASYLSFGDYLIHFRAVLGMPGPDREH